MKKTANSLSKSLAHLVAFSPACSRTRPPGWPSRRWRPRPARSGRCEPRRGAPDNKRNIFWRLVGWFMPAPSPGFPSGGGFEGFSLSVGRISAKTNLLYDGWRWGDGVAGAGEDAAAVAVGRARRDVGAVETHGALQSVFELQFHFSLANIVLYSPAARWGSETSA